MRRTKTRRTITIKRKKKTTDKKIKWREMVLKEDILTKLKKDILLTIWFHLLNISNSVSRDNRQFPSLLTSNTAITQRCLRTNST